MTALPRCAWCVTPVEPADAVSVEGHVVPGARTATVHRGGCETAYAAYRASRLTGDPLVYGVPHSRIDQHGNVMPAEGQ